MEQYTKKSFQFRALSVKERLKDDKGNEYRRVFNSTITQSDLQRHTFLASDWFSGQLDELMTNQNYENYDVIH